MSIQIPDAVYAPDLDAARTPGTLIDMSGFAPLQRGMYGSVSLYDTFSVTGTDAVHAETFRQVDDSVRLLVFRKGNIDEYAADGTRTNRGTGYNAATTDWSATAWGNQIIACNYLDATQSSTGAGFSALGDDAPKARYCAANLNFVMLADTDDGANQYSDQVWWSALQNASEWTPSIATQAGYVRLLDSPGPIKQLVAFRDTFVAFKADSVFVGEYVGPPFVFQWRMVSSRIGLAASHGVVELDDKLFWVHTSGIYQWDGASLVNISLGMFQSFLNTFGYVGKRASGYPPSGEEGTQLSLVRAVADDIEGVVWFSCYTTVVALADQYRMYSFGYNARTGKWSAMGAVTPALDPGQNPAVFVESKYSDMRTFFALDIPTQSRVWYLTNGVVGAKLRNMRYPDAWTSDVTGMVTTAAYGTRESSTDALRVWPRCLQGSHEYPFSYCDLSGYDNEQRTLGTRTQTCVLNAELDCFDGRMSARYTLAYLVGTTGKWCYLAGVGIEYPPAGSR